MSDLHRLNNNKIIIIIKVYKTKRTPGNLGIKSYTSNPKPVSDVKSSGVLEGAGKCFKRKLKWCQPAPSSALLLEPHSAATGIWAWVWGHFGHVPPLVPSQHPDAASTWGQAVRPRLQQGPWARWGWNISCSKSFSFGTLRFMAECTAIYTSWEGFPPFHHFQAAQQHPQNGDPRGLRIWLPISSPKTPWNSISLQKRNPSAQPQSSHTRIFWSWDLKGVGRNTPPQNTTIVFHITLVTAQKRRGSGKAIVSDRSK